MAKSAETRKLESLLRAARQADRASSPKRILHKRTQPTAPGQRQPPVEDPTYLKWVRRLPCVIGLIENGCSGPIEAAHLRFSDAARGRINSGMQAKPDDKWVTPLCHFHHQHDQHKRNERKFWDSRGIEAGELCEALHAAFRADQPGEPIIQRFAANSST